MSAKLSNIIFCISLFWKAILHKQLIYLFLLIMKVTLCTPSILHNTCVWFGHQCITRHAKRCVPNSHHFPSFFWTICSYIFTTIHKVSKDHVLITLCTFSCMLIATNKSKHCQTFCIFDKFQFEMGKTITSFTWKSFSLHWNIWLDI